MNAAFGGLNITGGAGTVALSTTAATLNVWSSAGGSNVGGTTNPGDSISIQPDNTNNRIKVSPGTYLVNFFMSGTNASGGKVTARVRKNGSAVTTLKASAQIGTTNGNLGFSGILTVNASDAPGTLPLSPDPSSSGFAGAGGAPKSLVPIDIDLTLGASTDTLTIVEAGLTLVKIL